MSAVRLINRIGQQPGIEMKSILIFLVLISCPLISFAENTQIHVAPEIGIINGETKDGKENFYLYTKVELSGIDSVLFVEHKNGKRTKKVIKLKTTDLIEIAHDEKAIGDEPLHTYQIKSESLKATESMLDAAVINAKMILKIRATDFNAISGNSEINIRTCFSSEGFHVVKWKSKKPIEDLYFYMGIDIEGNCKEFELPATK